jgi:hypothetical protein
MMRRRWLPLMSVLPWAVALMWPCAAGSPLMRGDPRLVADGHQQTHLQQGDRQNLFWAFALQPTICWRPLAYSTDTGAGYGAVQRSGEQCPRLKNLKPKGSQLTDRRMVGRKQINSASH